MERVRRRTVKRYDAERYVRISLVGFAATIIIVRVFLSLTGYPQIGNGTLHIAHVLWGGLALFVAALLPLIVANRWAFSLGALLSGVGVGLFIDEVGKFITQRNDYFFPAAAPIIYAFFLLTVLLYLRVRRPAKRQARAEMYRSLDRMTDVIDRQMDRRELATLQDDLDVVILTSDDESVRQLAAALLPFVQRESQRVEVPAPGRPERYAARVRAMGRRVFTRKRLKVALIVGLGVVGLFSLVELLLFGVIALIPPSDFENLLSTAISSAERTSTDDLAWLSTRLLVEGAVSFVLLVAAFLLLVRRERTALSLAFAGLLVYLTVVNILVFYQDQFQAIVLALIQYVLLMGVLAYRRLYLPAATVPGGGV